MHKPYGGGPAFPTPDYYDEKPIGVHFGMELRDYFAAKAMHAELVTAGALEGPRAALVRAAAMNGQTVTERIAMNAYELADAMLAQRRKLAPDDVERMINEGSIGTGSDHNDDAPDPRD